MIDRDDQGRGWCHEQEIADSLGALEMEAVKAIEVAAIFARGIGIQNVVFESDSL